MSTQPSVATKDLTSRADGASAEAFAYAEYLTLAEEQEAADVLAAMMDSTNENVTTSSKAPDVVEGPPGSALGDELDDEAAFLAAMAQVDTLSAQQLRVVKGLSPIAKSSEGADAVGGSSAAKTARPIPRKKGGAALGPLGVMNFVRANLPRKLVRQLRRGALRIQDDLDLHGLTWKEAKREVAQFLRNAGGESGHCCVLIIHGKGHGKVLGQATLKSRLYTYLQQHPHVVAAISALPKDGGLGAAYVLLG